MVVVAVVIPTKSSLLRVRSIQPCCADIQGFIRLLSTFHPRVQQDPLGVTSLMLRTSSSTSAIRITVEYDKVDGVGKPVKKSLKVEKLS